MIEYTGEYNTAKVMIDELDESTISQIYSFLNHPAFEGMNIVIMPDSHAGAGAVIGFTATMNDTIIPNVVGVDLGCSVLMNQLKVAEVFDYAKLDKFIRKQVPSGFNVRARTHAMVHEDKPLMKAITKVAEKLELKLNHVFDSLGSLGGGNHFIEIDKTDSGDLFLVIHSGSRNFGLRVATYHQKKAKKYLESLYGKTDAYKDAEWLEGVDAEEYLEDMMVAQRYASLNREVMMDVLLTGFFGMEHYRLQSSNVSVECMHNFISPRDNIIRKGAISAYEDEMVIIPFNMRDGTVIGHGKGNKEWNYSAPHGAGRVLSRRKAKENLTLEEFEKEMEGIWTTCVGADTLDESPMAYKDTQTIIDAIDDTVDVEFWMKPVYNFKEANKKWRGK